MRAGENLGNQEETGGLSPSSSALSLGLLFSTILLPARPVACEWGWEPVGMGR